MLGAYDRFSDSKNVAQGDNFMIDLSNTRAAWGADNFSDVLKNEMRTVAPDLLPLYIKSAQGGMMDFNDISVSILSVDESEKTFKVMLGIFFTELIGGCNCDDDPTPVNSWGKLEIAINRKQAATDFSLLEQS